MTFFFFFFFFYLLCKKREEKESRCLGKREAIPLLSPHTFASKRHPGLAGAMTGRQARH